MRIKLFEEYSSIKTLDLFHGTCMHNAERMIEFGWKANSVSAGANQGQTRYLYLSSGIEDARWFAEEKGCDVVIKISNIPIDYLKPDPEDEAGFTMDDLLSRIDRGVIPSKFVLIKDLPKENFEIL